MAIWSHKVNGDIIDADHINKLQDDKLDFDDTRLGYYTPEMFGAVGNGITDDGLFLQQAIDTAALVGGIVFCHAPSYYSSFGLIVRRGVHLKGVGTAHFSLYIELTRRGTALLINGAIGGDCLRFEENSGMQQLSDISVYNTNSNAIRSVVSMVGILHPRWNNVELGCLGVSTGAGLYLEPSAAGLQYETLYAGFHDVVIAGLYHIGSPEEASLAVGIYVNALGAAKRPAAIQFFGGSIQAKTKTLLSDGAGAGFDPRSLTFHGTSFEAVYNVGMDHVFVAGKLRIHGWTTGTDGYVVKLIDLKHALDFSFHGCYYEMSACPATYDDGINGVHDFAPVIYLDNSIEVKKTQFYGCAWSVYLYDNALDTYVSILDTGQNYDAVLKPRCVVRSAAAQAVVPYAFRTLVFGGILEETDNSIDWDTGTNIATIKEAGTYNIVAQVGFAGWIGATEYAQIRIVTSGGEFRGNPAYAMGAANPISTRAACMVTLAVGDTITFEVIQVNAANQDTAGAATDDFACITKV